MIAFALYALGGVLMLAHCNEAEARLGRQSNPVVVALVVTCWPALVVWVGFATAFAWLRGARG